MMQVLRSALDLDGFFQRLQSASSRVLMLDYDGTLAPFQVDPAQARPYPGIPALLDAIIQAGQTRLVIVSGRWIKSLVPLLDLKAMPEIWGSYGWERSLPDGDYSTATVRASAFEALTAAEQWVADIERLGARCERKPTALAFHWRGLAKERVVQTQPDSGEVDDARGAAGSRLARFRRRHRIPRARMGQRRGGQDDRG
jgi:trehalose-phosphatase